MTRALSVLQADHQRQRQRQQLQRLQLQIQVIVGAPPAPRPPPAVLGAPSGGRSGRDECRRHAAGRGDAVGSGLRSRSGRPRAFLGSPGLPQRGLRTQPLNGAGPFLSARVLAEFSESDRTRTRWHVVLTARAVGAAPASRPPSPCFPEPRAGPGRLCSGLWRGRGAEPCPFSGLTAWALSSVITSLAHS